MPKTHDLLQSYLPNSGFTMFHYWGSYDSGWRLIIVNQPKWTNGGSPRLHHVAPSVPRREDPLHLAAPNHFRPTRACRILGKNWMAPGGKSFTSKLRIVLMFRSKWTTTSKFGQPDSRLQSSPWNQVLSPPSYLFKEGNPALHHPSPIAEVLPRLSKEV